jgi:hypothetical protein
MALGLLLLVLMAFVSVEAMPVDSLGVLFGVSSAWGHGGFRRLV